MNEGASCELIGGALGGPHLARISAAAMEGGVGAGQGEDMLTTMAHLIAMHSNQMHSCSFHTMRRSWGKALLAAAAVTTILHAR